MSAVSSESHGIDIIRAEQEKERGNEFFKQSKYPEAMAAYSSAMELNPRSAVYLHNRAFCALRMDEFGLCISDCTRAIEIDDTYVKAYFRRGCALFALGKHEEALPDLRKCAKLAPQDAAARARLAECDRVVKEKRFLAAIASGEDAGTKAIWEKIDPSSCAPDSKYDGPRIPEGGVDGAFCAALVAHLRAEKRLHVHYVMRILLAMKDLLDRTPTVVDVPVPSGTSITVCGDVHGQYYDLLNIFELNGPPSETNPYLFNGDFVDRGSFSVEVILTLFAYKLAYPEHMHLNRGNHESRNMSKMYGFEGETKAKYSMAIAEAFSEVFCLLPLCAVLERKIFVVHGGLFVNDGVTLADLRKVDRKREPPDSGLMSEMLWSDPQTWPGRAPSKRGVGCSFGPDVTKDFLRDNNLEMVVRSHEVKPEGFEVTHDGHLVTIFSAPNYCDTVGNKGAFIRFTGPDMKPNYTSFAAVPHPAVPPLAYANSLFSFQ